MTKNTREDWIETGEDGKEVSGRRINQRRQHLKPLRKKKESSKKNWE